MFKTFFYGVLVGLIIGGLGWYSIGRNDLGQIRTDYNGAAGNLQRVQRNISELSTKSDGFAGNIAAITDSAKRIADRSRRINEGLTGFNGDFGNIIVTVDGLEVWNRRSLVLNRDFGDKLYDIRQLNKKGREEE